MRIVSALCGVILAGGISVSAGEWANADGSCFAKDVKTLSVGASLGDWGGNVAFDMGFHDAISGGVAVGYNAYFYGHGWVHHNVPVLVRAAFHPFNLAVLSDKIKIRDKLDVFIGPSIGWKFGGWSRPSGSTVPDPDYFALIVREYIGARWHFSPNVYVFIEDCAGLGWLNGGIGFKF